MITINFVDLCLHRMPCFVAEELGNHWARTQPDDLGERRLRVKEALDRCRVRLESEVFRDDLHKLNWERLDLGEVWYLLVDSPDQETILLNAGRPMHLWEWLYATVLEWHRGDPRLSAVADHMAQSFCPPVVYGVYERQGLSKLDDDIFRLTRMWSTLAGFSRLVWKEMNNHTFHVDSLGTSEPL